MNYDDARVESKETYLFLLIKYTTQFFNIICNNDFKEYY
jgi:hypothetical protein